MNAQRELAKVRTQRVRAVAAVNKAAKSQQSLSESLGKVSPWHLLAGALFAGVVVGAAVRWTPKVAGRHWTQLASRAWSIASMFKTRARPEAARDDTTTEQSAP